MKYKIKYFLSNTENTMKKINLSEGKPENILFRFGIKVKELISLR